MASITTRSYPNGEERVRSGALDDVTTLLAQSDCEFVWVDLDDPAEHDLLRLAEDLGLHHLAVEAALDRHQRNTLVVYEHHAFLSAHAVELDDEAGELRTDELDVFFGERWIVTIHRGARDVVDRIAASWDEARRHSGNHVGVAVYALLAVFIGGYFDTIDAFETFYDQAADRVFGEDSIEPDRHRHWFEMRRALNQLDRIVGPLSEALSTVVDDELDHLAAVSAPYLRDTGRELARASTEVGSLQQLVDHLVDANLQLREYRQNQVMKKVTSWAAIIAVPTLVTGYYGMNVPYPGTDQTWGVVASTAIAAGAAGTLYLTFRRKQWL